MAIDVSLATAADDASIRGLLQREPLPGRLSISFEREPNFSLGCEATGDNPVVLVARDVETNATVGVACRSEREAFVNSKPMRLGYLGQLRVDQRYRGRWLVSRGYSMLKRLHESDPIPAYLAAVTSDNREAAGVLIDKPRKRFPAFHAVANYSTLAIPVGRSNKEADIAAATVDDVPTIIRFLQRHGPRRQFFPVWTVERLLGLVGRLGLQVEDIRIARTDGRITGVMGLWDQSSYKQNVVRAYSGWMRLAALAGGVFAPLLRRPRLPKVGKTIRSGYATFVCVAEDDKTIFGELLSATLETARAKQLDYLLLGLDERDPLLTTALQRPHVLYRSRLYLAEWPSEDPVYEQLDQRPSYVEIATL